MVVYYLGNPYEKRLRLLSVKDAVYLDNDNVLACYGKGSRYCFIVGKVCFADFTVWEYLSYAKSLELKRPLRMEEARELISKTGYELGLNKKLSKLDPISLRVVKLAAAIRPDTTRICINFDGVLYSRKRQKRMKKLIDALNDYQLFVSVSDMKFVPKEGTIKWCLGDKTKLLKAKIIRGGRRATRLFSS